MTNQRDQGFAGLPEHHQPYAGQRRSSTLKIAYADPPYPGWAHLYEGHPDYAGEVDHPALISHLRDHYDGWALSTSAKALHDLLPFCPDARLLAWVKNTVRYAWEPVIVVPAREPAKHLRDWLHCEPDAYQWRPKPDSYVIGQKPTPFCRWMFEWLGAQPGDEFEDIFPGSGNVGRAWSEWSSQPQLTPVSKRARRRAAAESQKAFAEVQELT